MAGRFEGKVVFITGAARGQGRAEAIRFAEEGADVIALDICDAPGHLEYPAATEADLAVTVKAVEAAGGRIYAERADVRDLDAVCKTVQGGFDAFGRLDVVVANAGITTWGRFWEIPLDWWHDVIDINLTGVFHTLRAAVPLMIEADNGGSIVAISSVAGLKSLPSQAHYSASKHGVVGLVNSAAVELAPYRIRVNSVHPWAVDTDMTKTSDLPSKVFMDNPSYAAVCNQYWFSPTLSVPDDIANAVLWLASDEARTVTGIQLPVDHGATKT